MTRVARSPSGESVLTRAVRILDAFGPDDHVLTVTEISRRADLPLPTAGRMVGELVRHGLLHRDQQRRVRIGVRLWELAQRASPTLRLREVVMPFMEDVHAVVGHSTQLGVLDGDEVLFVERLSAPRAVINLTRIAGRLPLHVSSAGQVLLAHASPELQERVLRGPLRALTSQTLTEAATLRTTLARVRTRGFAFCPGHVHPDATGVAVPLRGPDGRVVAALSLVIPNDEQAWSRVGLLQSTARAIDRALRQATLIQ
ncbi:IclR family transcriptional regulator [Saccharopolyspora mangrovi]|uniref:IclR family transcriptional regulator n=1 Tax=Saccharopolyspora mangrovi TaxID=3082379 RepID=A0ABU6AJP9_9PSEU|nr:IclR family transcriptional regulator [Saccharopolyspora sp. S2-29]MEB3371687.1 IclR family transcriptional regulator [Saccharopolyspora sp. S2-29]